jgi:hypothetical protein
MSRDILSRLFSTTRVLELEYSKVSLLQENGAEFKTSARIEETGEQSPITELTSFADAIWL